MMFHSYWFEPRVTIDSVWCLMYNNILRSTPLWDSTDLPYRAIGWRKIYSSPKLSQHSNFKRNEFTYALNILYLLRRGENVSIQTRFHNWAYRPINGTRAILFRRDNYGAKLSRYVGSIMGVAIVYMMYTQSCKEDLEDMLPWINKNN